MKWISVKDQLPPLNHQVLVWTDGSISCAYLEDINEDSRIRARTRHDKYPVKFEWCYGCSCCSYNYDEPTCWMSLPI